MLKLAWLALVGAASGCGPGASSGADHAVASESAEKAASLQDECPLVDDTESFGTSPRALNRDAVRRSDEGVRRLATVWPPTPLLVELVRGSIARFDRRSATDDPSLGFDAYRTTERVSENSYVWCTVEAVLFRSELVMARADCDWGMSEDDADSEACLLRRYGATLSGMGLTINGTRATARIEFSEVLARMHQARLAELGEADDDAPGQPARDPSDPLSQAEALLSDPLARLAVGPAGPTGERADVGAARRLVDARALDALRRVLRGPNPEGRAFAAVGLSSLDALSPQDARVIELLAQTSTVTFKSGCLVTIDSARNFYANLRELHWLFEDRAR